MADRKFANVASAPGDFEFNLRYPGQSFDRESGLYYNYFRSYNATTGRYTQPDPIGLDGGWNRFGYVEGNPIGYTDAAGLTRADIDAALSSARAMKPDWRFPSDIKTWSQEGKGGKHSFWDSEIYVDSKFLDCLDDGEAAALLSAVLHELAHYNQKWYQFGIDNIRERATRGNSSNAQDVADALMWKHYQIIAQYLKNRKPIDGGCGCKK